MSAIPEPAIQTAVLGIPVIPLITDIFFGVIGLIVILIFHGGTINHILMRFDKRTELNMSLGQYNRVFIHFYTAFIYIACIHVIEIVLWSVYLIILKLIPDGIEALIFAGSCYTTVGFAADSLPPGWKSLAFFIAMTGLFSIAWTTSVMIGMTDLYKRAWRLKYKKHT